MSAGPEEEEGQPPGTVFVAVSGTGGGSCRRHGFDGDPEEVLTATALEALKALVDHLRAGSASG